MKRRASARSSSLSAALVLTATLALCALAAPVLARPDGQARRHASHLALKMIWGPVTLPGGQSAFPTYHQLGVQVLQLILSWADTAPTRPNDATSPSDPAYRWPQELDQAVSQARQYGIHLCLLVQGSPGWANAGQQPVWAPTNPADYAHFLIAASRRYPSIRAWMIWGEPNRTTPANFEPMPDHSPVGPKRYAQLLQASYAALKSVSKSNIVIGGDTWSFGGVEPADFIRWMRLPNGKPPQLDYYGHNPYGERFPRLAKPYFPGGRDIDDIGTLEAQLAHVYGRRVPLWLSEFSINSDHANSEFNFYISQADQARWLTAAYQLVNSVPYVAGLGWFELLDESGLTSGLLSASLQPKPDFYAYERAR